MNQIGRYQILGELGRGAMGVVYRAQDPAIGRIVAIKTIRLSDLTDPEERQRLRERLFREAQAAGILSHPNIVTIYDVAEEDSMAYVFMEFVNGPPLERALSDPNPPNRELIPAILRQTASALDYAHSKGIVHRDIKPSNIMLHEGVQAKVTDFGVAKLLSQQMTQSGTMMGTPNYMSPEQVQGHAVDGRSDQFSLGVIAYEMLTGEKPFVGEYLPTLLYKIVREDPVAPQRLNRSLGDPTEAVLRKALAKNLEDRYESCSQFVADLASALEASPGWQPLARGASQNMPTLAPISGLRNGGEKPVSAPALVLPPLRHPRREEEPETNPLLKSLVWMLVGLGLVGLVLLGAQRYIFNRQLDEPVAASQPPSAPTSPAPTPTAPPAETEVKPSPVPATPNAPEQKAEPEPESKTERTKAAADTAASPEPSPTEPPAQKKAAREAPIAASSRGAPSDQEVQFLTEPPGAQVTIDSNAAFSCRTPCQLTLPPGRHALTTQMDGYRPYPRVFTVPQESDLFLQLAKISATLSITSNPPGAAILLNGVEQKSLTPAMINVAPGTYHVRVTRSGVPLDFDVSIKDGEFINKNVTF